INPITGQFIPPLTVAGNLFQENNVPYDKPGLEDLAQQVLKRGVLLVEDLEIMPTYQSMFMHSEDLRSFAALALHIQHRQKLLGVLYLNFRRQQEFSSADHKLLQIFADQASFILQETWLLLRY